MTFHQFTQGLQASGQDLVLLFIVIVLYFALKPKSTRKCDNILKRKIRREQIKDNGEI